MSIYTYNVYLVDPVGSGEVAIPYLGSLIMVAERTVAEMLEALLGGTGAPALLPRQEAAAARVAAKADELIAIYRDEQHDIARDAAAALHLLGTIPHILRWDTGLKQAWGCLVLAAVHEAERFGNGTGTLKRKFASDLVVRALESYNFGGLPFLTIQKTLLAPVIGILIDWTVEVLNNHTSCWRAPKRVRQPSMTYGQYECLLGIALGFSRIIMWFSGWIRAPSRYQRQLRDAYRRIAPEARQLTLVLPPERFVRTVEDVANVVVELGKRTAPYTGLVQHVLSFGEDFIGLSTDERIEAVVMMLRDLLREAYAGDPFASMAIDSPFGDYLLRAIVGHAHWVLAENGLVA